MVALAISGLADFEQVTPAFVRYAGHGWVFGAARRADLEHARRLGRVLVGRDGEILSCVYNLRSRG